jgi:hypothetical protein
LLSKEFPGVLRFGGAQTPRDCLATYQADGFGQFEIEALD